MVKLLDALSGAVCGLLCAIAILSAIAWRASKGGRSDTD